MHILHIYFLPTAFKGCVVLFLPMSSGWMGGCVGCWVDDGKNPGLGCISETVNYSHIWRRWALNLHIAIVLLCLRVHYSVEIKRYKS